VEDPLNATGVAVLERWVKRTAGLKTVVADFRQERKLLTLRKPLETTGKLWLSAADGAFRLQSGDPPKLVAVRRATGELTVLFPEKKEAEVMAPEEVERSEMGQALRFLTVGFPESVAGLRKQFVIEAVKATEGWHQIQLRPAGASPGAMVSNLIVQVETATGTPGALHLNFRDGSRVSNTFTKVEENVAIPADCFTPALDGYRVKRK
jgi:outer membrane lipoprotein-sorting protein